MSQDQAFIVLAVIDRVAKAGPVARFVETFGRVPMFYCRLHLPLIQGLALLTNLVRYREMPPGIRWGTELAAARAAGLGRRPASCARPRKAG